MECVVLPFLPLGGRMAGFEKPLVTALCAGVVALAILVLTAGRNPRRPGEPAPLVIEARKVLSPTASVAPVVLGERREPVGRTAAPVPVQPNPLALTRQFRARQPELDACFRAHPEPVAAAERVSLRFEVDRTGRVTRANVLPAPLERSAFGRCMLGVATSAQFGPLSHVVAFSIPIAAPPAPDAP